MGAGDGAGCGGFGVLSVGFWAGSVGAAGVAVWGSVWVKRGLSGGAAGAVSFWDVPIEGPVIIVSNWRGEFAGAVAGGAGHRAGVPGFSAVCGWGDGGV